MSIKLHFAEFSPTNMSFSYSVLHELLFSLRVLDTVKQHPLHITWALDVLKQLPADFHAERRYFKLVLCEVVWMIWKSYQVETPSFEGELSDFCQNPLDEFIQSIVTIITAKQAPSKRRVYDNLCTMDDFQASEVLQAQAREWLQIYYPDSIDIVDDLLDDGAGLKARFVQMIETYWSLIFATYWADLEHDFLEEIRTRGQALYHKGVLSAFDNLAPRAHFDHEAQTVTFVANNDREDLYFSADYQLHLIPSYFLYPSMMFQLMDIKISTTQSLAITYPIPEAQLQGRSPVPPDDLVQMLRALSDHTRLQILQMLAQKARSTSEIANIIGISDAAISKHLKILQQAGWVTFKRQSYYVLYRATKAPLESLNYGLQDLLTGEK